MAANQWRADDVFIRADGVNWTADGWAAGAGAVLEPRTLQLTVGNRLLMADAPVRVINPGAANDRIIGSP